MWTKLGDEFPDEARDLSDAAFRTLTEAWCWSNRRLLDLVIDQRDLKRFAETANPEAAVEELVDTGWWQDLGDGRWFVGCKFSEWQRDRSQVEHRRDQLAQAQKRRRRHLVGDHSLCLNCKASDESTVDATDDYGDDPGRDGTGRVRDSNYATEEKRKGSPRATEVPKGPMSSSPDVQNPDNPGSGRLPRDPHGEDPHGEESRSGASPMFDQTSSNSPEFGGGTHEVGTCRGCGESKPQWVLKPRDGHCITCFQSIREPA